MTNHTTITDLNDIRQALYLVADEMRGMASIGRAFAGNIYEAERAHRVMELAAEIAALAEIAGESGADSVQVRAEVRAIFEAEPWLRVSPVVGVDAAVFDPGGAILLIQRRDNGHWAMPGGLAEIGMSFPETAVKELWEEAGVRGRVARLLGVFDARFWGSRVKTHLVNMVFQVACDECEPQPGVEALDAGYFARDALPAPLHPGHDTRVPEVFARRGRDAYFDPADWRTGDLPLHQRPEARDNGRSSAPDPADRPPQHGALPALWFHPLIRR